MMCINGVRFMARVSFESSDAMEFPSIEKFSWVGREKHSVVAELDGCLLRGSSSFPSFAVVAFETGGVVRLLALLLAAPLAGLLYCCVCESAGRRVLVFVTFVGLRTEEIESVARAVLPKFYWEDVHSKAWEVFSSCGERCVLTANPRMLVEPFVKEYLGAEKVIGTELQTWGGRATGLLRRPGLLVGSHKAHALINAFAHHNLPRIALAHSNSDFPFIRLCKEGYIVPSSQFSEAVSKSKLPKPIVFHDGRLVQRPTPLRALIIILWIPVGFILACLRITAGALLPMSIVYYAFWCLGVKVVIRGSPPSSKKGKKGVLYVSTHRTLLDPIFLSTALGRPIPAVTYSVSRLSEFLSPIKTVRLNRDRIKDGIKMQQLLEEGELVLCPEGTTCREPFLLRFSALFAELTDQIVPVAMNNKMSMFHGTTARGWKGMDPFYFFMNPCPTYELTFLNQLPLDLTCSGGRNPHEVANCIQRVLAATLAHECTALTRKDKYKALVGNDGIATQKVRSSIMGC